MADNNTQPVETIESLRTTLKEATAAHATAKDALDAEVLEHNTTRSNLANALAELAERTGELSEATTVIEGQRVALLEQADQIDTLQANPSSVPSFVVNKKTYEVHTKLFQYEKKEYTVEQLLKDKALQKKLVEKGVGFLIEKEA